MVMVMNLRPTHYATHNTHTHKRTWQAIIKKDADVSAVTRYRRTALHYAGEQGYATLSPTLPPSLPPSTLCELFAPGS